jgi:4-hydroxybenzoyl-CoA reductase subunit beta
MPAFRIAHPTTVKEAVALRASADSDYLAGGTDLLVNLKHRLRTPELLVALGDIPELTRIHPEADGLRIGAMATLDQVQRHPWLTRLPGLGEALRSIAGPQHRQMGTLGGNVLLDTRCLFYNQPELWRTALGKCLKADGDWCHVIDSGKACVAAQSSDSVPMLTALGATLRFQTVDGPADRALEGLFSKDGRYDRMLKLPRTALLESIFIPGPSTGHRSTYRKVRARDAVDYPQLSVALVASFDGEVARQARLVLGAMLPAPRVLGSIDQAIGVRWTEEVITAVTERAFKIARPMRSIHGDPGWRREQARVETARAMRSIRP